MWLIPTVATNLLSSIEANGAGEVLATLALRELGRKRFGKPVKLVEIGCCEYFTPHHYNYQAKLHRSD